MPRDLDLSYLDITPDDRDPQAIFDSALARATTLLPTWTPRNGNVETVLMESLALGVADAIYALNRIPPVMLEAILTLYGVVREVGTQAVGEVTLSFDDTRSLEIPVGMQMQDPTTGIVFYTRDDTTVTSATSAVVTVVAVDTGSAANQVPVSTSLDLIDLIPYTTSAVMTTAPTGGTDPEDDAAFFDRASTVLARVTSSLVVPEHFTAFALQDARVTRATTVDLFDVTAGSGSPGDHVGEISVYVYGVGGLLAAAVKTELEEAMQERTAAMMDVHVADADITTQAVTATVVALAGYDTSAVQAACEAAITAWMDPSVWEWDDDIRPNDIITLLGNIDGVDYVDTVSVPAGVTPISTPGGLAQAGTLTISVS